ncbi:srs domain-containing protein [Neospora caninum Liverpool]|uniref:Srs domain-containing protein n=1 Tax=Neospora caninum (strain Liverpool) TaxID=572307 RepID=F0V8C5_NEOCL|nr:srs domain-containing protein [Neospora caninum Liverpool]CBZ49966.1 srs domain-containing protein [Neospora caninum Liverpool]CEL64554.1 TPA: SRS domain-containing protein [Neospora caninum Liverpool]|eukprot:XP_003880001.1 srs domain-containing protein [Neospora caninum Liverpool]
MARTCRMQQRPGRFRSTARKLMAACLGGVLLISGREVFGSGQGDGSLRRNLASQAAGPQTQTDVTNGVATCNVAGEDEGAPATATLTFWRGSLTGTLQCLGETNKAVPENLQTVCDGHTATATLLEADTSSCQIGSHKLGNKVTLGSILGTTPEVKWTRIGEEEHNSQVWRLQLAETDLPLADKTFFVGCQKGASTDPSCKVTVNVKARPSSVNDNNVVTCAYGKDSNQKAVKVEMSQDKNTLTIDCGSDGSMQPAEFTSQYCSPEGDTLEDCSKANYSDILPAFASTWWTNTENKIQATLTIPKTDFPPADRRLLLGCKTQNANQPTKEENLTESVSETSACRVLVTVKASSSASSASFTPQVTAATSGAALLAGILSGCL